MFFESVYMNTKTMNYAINSHSIKVLSKYVYVCAS